MNNSDLFKNDAYLDLKGIIPKDMCNLVSQYALLQELVTPRKEEAEGQVPFAHSGYGDLLMETLMLFMKPHMEAHTGLELCPTYTYFRVYRPGMILERHTDRPSCEVSTTVCLGTNYTNVSQDFNWGMYVDNTYRHNADDNGFISANNPGKMIAQSPGDIIVYRGCEIEHWREEFAAGEGSWQVQAFFHYINKDGPYYPEFAYDKRPGIGFSLRHPTEKT